ncbi:unnamed protein product [Caretta caretta]
MEKVELRPEDLRRQEMAAVAERKPWEGGSKEDEDPGQRTSLQVKDLLPRPDQGHWDKPPPINLDLLSNEGDFVEEQRNDPTLSWVYKQLQ